MSEEGEVVNAATLPLPQLQEIVKQYEQKIQYINASLQQLRRLQGSFASSRECLKQFSDENRDKTILVPLTSTLCVPGKLVEPTHVLIDIGTGYFADVEAKDAAKHFTRRIDFIDKQIEKIAPVLAQKSQEHKSLSAVLEAKMQAVMKAQTAKSCT
ncbi:hypothetical protein AAHC03_019237 [Spirometra sp. Aus1]